MIDPQKFGVSFSLKQCRNFGIDTIQTLEWLMDTVGFQRFRLMSYWNEHEREPGKYDFSALDKQVQLVAHRGGVISLCLGARQPRWPENHWPDWAWELPKKEREAALLRYIEQVVRRYRGVKAIISYQLENEALLKAFGERPEVDRKRLRTEFALVKSLDPKRPVIMSTSTSWGIPIRRPIPDVIGHSFYRIIHRNGRYYHAAHFPRLDRARALASKVFYRKPSFIHELQLEPWGPTAIWKMPILEQDKSMSTQNIRKNVLLARKTKLYPIDVWGGEWWYWRAKHLHDPAIWLAVAESLQDV